jgi:replicative DNA helicase
MKRKAKSVFAMTEGDLIVKEYNANTICSNDLMANINDLMMYKGFKPDVVIVDYILIMNTNDKKLDRTNSYSYFKNVTEELRNIGKTLYLPIITACQINRQGMDEKGGSKSLTTAKDISESRGIYDTVDVFTTINQTANDRKKNKFFVYFDKNRNERTGATIEYAVDYEHMKLTEKGVITIV